MPVDPTLYALVRENNRMLKELTERLALKAVGDIKVESASRPENDRASFIRPEFVECPSCRAKPGSPPLCAECLERRELFGLRAKYGADVASIRATGEGVRRGPITESDMRHVLKTGDLPPMGQQVQPIKDNGAIAYSATERLVLGQVADRLWAILNPNTQPSPSWTMADALEGVEKLRHWTRETEHKVRDAALTEAISVLETYDPMTHIAGDRIRALLHGETAPLFTKRALEESKADARDAALEEAATAIASAQFARKMSPQDWDWGMGDAQHVVRALKTKPAPTKCIVPGCVLKPGHVPHSHHKDASGKTWCTDVTEDFIASCQPQPEPVHDFGWALQRMRAGKKVRRKVWPGNHFYEEVTVGGGRGLKTDRGGEATLICTGDALATDWEVVE